MALQTTMNINVDFYDNKYILINAKQYDDSSRLITITCYNQGDIFSLSAGKHSAYVKYRKADGNPVLNFCKINYKGEVLVELTEQMLAASGICDVELVVINKGSAMVDIDTGDIIAIDDTPILSTMAFRVNVYETTVDNSEIISSYEFDGLNDLLERAEADYSDVIRAAKSYTEGNAGGYRDGEDTDNAQYYYEQSLINAKNAATSEANAKTSEDNAKDSETNAAESEDKAKTSEINAKTSETNSKTSETNAKTSETNSAVSEKNAKVSETNAATSEQNAKSSETNAKTSETNAAESEINAKESENSAQSYAVGGTGTRENEDMDNAKYYCEVVKSVVDSLNSGFIPMGTITFTELANVQKATGFTYNISDDFVTNDTFAEGAGKAYTAGTNVYFRADGLWDCFGGSASPTATVDEVINYLDLY